LFGLCVVGFLFLYDRGLLHLLLCVPLLVCFSTLGTTYYRKDNITLVVTHEQQAGPHKTTGATSSDHKKKKNKKPTTHRPNK
jgi:hypothetical protein